jgi:hypothetical protein
MEGVPPRVHDWTNTRRAASRRHTIKVGWIKILLVGSCVLTSPSCEDDEVKPCDLWTASAIVSGRVTDGGTGGPIVNTELEVKVATGAECDGAEQWEFSTRVTTDGNGEYAAQLEIGNASGFRCIGVVETNSGTLERGVVEFVGGCNESRPPGELNLDLTL